MDDLDKKIIEIVEKSPKGLRLKKLAEKVALPYSTIRYRALSLEKHGHVTVVQTRNKFTVYPNADAHAK
jgi:DNA-binding Lrp family transcriptional regulator